MAKKHLILAASVAAALAVGAPVAMAAPLPLPALPGIPSLPAGGPVTPNGGDCSFEHGNASAQSDVPALQLPVAGLNDDNGSNCVSSGNDQGNGAGQGMSIPSVPGTPE